MTSTAQLLTRPEPTLFATPSYRLRLASSNADVRAAQMLRFLVFNVEMREGLQSSFETCLDADRFDAVCDHLLVEDRATREIVGTYRLQTGARAAINHGYYCEREFHFAPFERLRPKMVELGRACIRADHRSFAVLTLLWSGIGAYARQAGAQYLIGCSSLTTQDTAVGAATFQRLLPHLAPTVLRTAPVEAFACPLQAVAQNAPKTPKLLTAYLGLGATICAAPAIDREFGTIDFLTIVDLQQPSFGRRLARLGLRL